MKVYNTLEFPFGKHSDKTFSDFAMDFPYMYFVKSETLESSKLYFAFLTIDEYLSLPIDKKITDCMETLNFLKLFKLL